MVLGAIVSVATKIILSFTAISGVFKEFNYIKIRVLLTAANMNDIKINFLPVFFIKTPPIILIL